MQMLLCISFIYLYSSIAIATVISGNVMIKRSSHLTTFEVEVGMANIIGTNCFSKIQRGKFHFTCNLKSKHNDKKEYTLRIAYPFNQRMYLFDHKFYSDPKIQYYKHDFLNTEASFRGFQLLPYRYQVNMTPDELWAMNQDARIDLLAKDPSIFKYETASDICVSPKKTDIELDEEEFISNLYLKYDQSDEKFSIDIYQKAYNISQKIAAAYPVKSGIDVCLKTYVILGSFKGQMTVYGHMTEIEHQENQQIYTQY